MSSFHDYDRPLLLRACQLAEQARCPPRKLHLKPEPGWAALVPIGERESDAAVFSPGGSEDAVEAILGRLGPQPDSTLYLTLEPKPAFQRLPPVTESVRRLGVKRVVIGTLDPDQRFRGEGCRTLQQAGLEVVLADGEVARHCQLLLEDYTKWLQRGLAVLRAQVGIGAEHEGFLDLKFGEGARSLHADALVCRAGGPRPEEGAWRVVLDPEGWERPAGQTVLYQSAPPIPGPGVRLLPKRNGEIDLGSVLRDLGSLGIISAELSGDAELFRLALRSGLIESVRAHFDQESDSARALSPLGRVRLSEGGDPLEIRLNAARFVGGEVEARPELC
jgi:hypothetical protein